ncbi:AlpA family phage regulatory protein [Alphaproteobacteria bacterium]|nr:AlpA family phage regulatory protein [Alphaproteobacteria bacterium]
MQSTPLSEAPKNSFRALRIQQVLDKTGLSRTHTYRLIAQGDHPKPIQLSERVFVWNEADIDAWLEAKFGGDEA